VHGMGKDPAVPDWPPLTTAEVTAVLARYAIDGSPAVTWRSPRPMSAAALVRRPVEDGGDSGDSGDVFVKRHDPRVRSLGQLAAELSRTVRDGRVEVRLMGGDADLVWVEDPSAEAGPEEDVDADANARITLRLPAALKSRIEAASARDGVSVNTYIVRALGQQSRPDRGPKVGKRLTGYGRS